MNAQQKAPEPNPSIGVVKNALQLATLVATAAMPGIVLFACYLLVTYSPCCMGLRPYVTLILNPASWGPAPSQYASFFGLAGAIGATLWVVMLAIMTLAPASKWPEDLPSDDSISDATAAYREVEGSFRWLFAGLTGIWFQSCMMFALIFLIPTQSHLWIQILCVVSITWATAIRLAAKKMSDSAINRMTLNIDRSNQMTANIKATTAEIEKLSAEAPPITTTQALREFVGQVAILASATVDYQETLARTMLVSKILNASSVRIHQLDAQLSEGYGVFAYNYFVLSMIVLFFFPFAILLALWEFIWLGQGIYTAVRLSYGLALLPVDYSEIEKAAKKVRQFEKVSVTVGEGRSTTIASKITGLTETYVIELFAVNKGKATLREAYVYIFAPSEIRDAKINSCIGESRLNDGTFIVEGNICVRHSISLRGPIFPAQTIRIAEFQFSPTEGRPYVRLYWQYLSASISEEECPRSLLLAEIPQSAPAPQSSRDPVKIWSEILLRGIEIIKTTFGLGTGPRIP